MYDAGKVRISAPPSRGLSILSHLVRLHRRKEIRMKLTPVASQKEWEGALEKLRAKEKQAARARDALAAERRRLPRVRIEKDYVFEGPGGKVGLIDGGEVYRTYFTSGRGVEALGSVWT